MKNKPVGVIVKSSVFNVGHNDGSEIQEFGNKGIADVVLTEDEIDGKLVYWNKLYYQDLYMHFIILEKQYNEFKSIIGLEGDFSEHNPIGPKNWPSELDNETYLALFEALKLQFVRFEEYAFPDSAKYLIRINEQFWNMPKSTGVSVLADVLEQKINSYEQIYDDYEEALENGLIFTSRMCIAHDNGNAYWYAQKVKEELKTKEDSLLAKLNGFNIDYSRSMPIFDFNYYTYSKEERMPEYEKVKKNEAALLEFYKELYHILDQKPFEIVEIIE